METPLIETHRAAGARLAEYDGCVLPESFSDLEREYRAARESVALFDANWQAIVTLAGRDRVKYLHNISSNDIKGVAEWRGTLALLLTPQGRILAELDIYALPEKLIVLSHASQRERTVGTLKKYVIGSQVQIEDVTEQFGSVGVAGPRAAEVVERACAVAIGELADLSIREAAIDGAACYVVRRSQFGEAGAEIIAPRASLAALWERLLAEVRAAGGEPIGMVAFHALRLEAGVPWFPADFSDAMIPHEAALETTHISFTKGCYTGQEIVERVRSRGHVNRKRVPLKFSVAVPPAPGTKLLASGAEIGFVSSSAFSPAVGTAIGMGYVRREQFEPGSVVEFDGGTATVSETSRESTVES
ncbi:MAG TPA: glycine cleavage T C-terminal barrel domain-containing protein [Candidatus Acidoferrales bacterium]|nr:glycine cleavage T C-terminal barrel domain-containing protein [Candidatus Acidoferrales bacterium]